MEVNATTERKNVRAVTAMHQFSASLKDVARWAERSGEPKETMLVDYELVKRNRDAEQAQRASEGEQASTSDNPRTARAGAKRAKRSQARVKLDFPLTPGDRALLKEVQDWVDAQRDKVAWVPDPGWIPENRKKGDELGTFNYETPAGWVDNVPAADFRRMINGTMAWRVPDPSPSAAEMRKYAGMLESLTFQAKECRLCGKPIESGKGPEWAQIHRLLNGRFVLPYIKHALAPGQEEMRFRRLHMMHAVWEEELVEVQLTVDLMSDQELVERLYSAVPKVLKDAQRRVPSTTEEDVYSSLDEVLALWETEDAQAAAASESAVSVDG